MKEKYIKLNIEEINKCYEEQTSKTILQIIFEDLQNLTGGRK